MVKSLVVIMAACKSHLSKFLGWSPKRATFIAEIWIFSHSAISIKNEDSHNQPSATLIKVPPICRQQMESQC